MSVLRNISCARIKTLVRQSHVPIRNSSVANTKEFKKLKEMQATMQCNDDVPVYLKRGTPDRILYRFILLLTAYGCIDGLRFLWRSAKK